MKSSCLRRRLRLDGQVVAKQRFRPLQETEKLDGSGKRFFRDKWDRNQQDVNAGYGITAVLEGGDLLEKACPVQEAKVSSKLQCT